MSRVQEQVIRSIMPPALFAAAVYFAGSNRLIQYLPGATRKGLGCSAAMSGLAVIGGNLAHKKSDPEWKRAGLIIGGLALSSILTPYIAKGLLRRVDLNFKASFRFALVEGLIVGGVEIYVIGRRPLPAPPREHPPRDRKINESLELGGISEIEMLQDPHKIRGFDKRVQGPWLLGQIQETCRGKAFCVGTIIADANRERLDLDALLAGARLIPTVMLVDNGDYYSVVVYEPNEKWIYCYNPVSTDQSPNEQKVVGKMQELFEVYGVIHNKSTSQKVLEDWSSAFRVAYFLEHFLEGSSMDNVDAARLPLKSLARRLDVYYHFLYDSQCSIPEDWQLFYDGALEGQSVEQLKNLMQNACKNGFGDMEKFSNQIQCILVKLWAMEQEKRGTFTEFARAMREFTEGERAFLNMILEDVGRTKGAIVNRLNEAYFSEYGKTIDPEV
ncbi:MAG: hypothetical protein KFB95_01250 [Simkaniaceae bacterium]|nr:MAG: hypothetical protein KFB95_01250 [Simkaniaceae bacterium]